MLANNQYNVHSNSKNEQDKKNGSVHIHSNSFQTSELKRAFTVLPSANQHSSIKSASELKSNEVSASSEESVKQKSMAQKSMDDKSMAENNEWPSIEELEALIRGEQHEQHVDIEWLELPLQFEKQRESSVKDLSVNQFPHDEVIDISEVNRTSKSDKLSHMHEKSILEQSAEKLTYSAHIDESEHLLANQNQGYNSNIPYYMSNKVAPSEEKQRVEQYSVSWGKIATAIMSSIITGVLIGYVLLLALYGVQVWPVNMISEKMSKSEVASSASSNQSTDNIPSIIEPTLSVVDDSTGSSNSSPVSTETAAVVIQPVQTFTYTAFQAGVFAKQDTKQAMLDQLKGYGYPAASLLMYDGKYVVFAGMASSQQATYQMNHMDKIELYKKSFSLHVPHLSENEQLDTELQQWMFNVQNLFTSYMKINEAQFEQSGFSAIYAESYNVLQEKANQVMQETTRMKDVVTEAALLEKLEWHEQAFAKMNDLYGQYQQKPNANTLFAVEQHLLDMLAYQNEWFMNQTY